MDFSAKRILVVGASGVLGGEITRMLSRAGAQVLGTASSQESAARIPSEAALRLVVDLGSAESIKVLTDYIVANEQIDGIVVAAGRVGFGMAAETTSQQVATLTQVNFGGPTQLITELLPALLGREDAFIAAITGVVAEKSFPGMSAYCASKSAFSAWLGSLAFELRRDKIKVIDARPGHTETGLASRPLFGTAPQMPEGMTAEHVAGVVVAAIAAGTTVVASADF